MLPLTKRQREILDYLNDFIQQHGYAPSLEEIGRRFNLSSLATVHKHLNNLQEKGFIRRAWNRSRSVELVPTRGTGRAVELQPKVVQGILCFGRVTASGDKEPQQFGAMQRVEHGETAAAVCDIVLRSHRPPG